MKDEIIFNSRFKFDAKVSEVFDNMISRSIPDYENFRYLTNSLIEAYFKEPIKVVDIGCSTGLASDYLIRYHKDYKFMLVDESLDMIVKCMQNYNMYDNVEYLCGDAFSCDLSNTDLCICSFVLQFMPNRKDLVKKIYDNLKPGGVLIVSEKLRETQLEDLTTDVYYQIKKENGYTEEQIKSKREALENYLVPMTFSQNESLLNRFRKISCYWKCLNFAAWICIK